MWVLLSVLEGHYLLLTSIAWFLFIGMMMILLFFIIIYWKSILSFLVTLLFAFILIIFLFFYSFLPAMLDNNIRFMFLKLTLWLYFLIFPLNLNIITLLKVMFSLWTIILWIIVIKNIYILLGKCQHSWIWTMSTVILLFYWFTWFLVTEI